ncbi:hypothetical protein [Halomicrobium urmianum]|uniref:hypothetical protein n=1 Tax=Halomicrobium urmianum TaxID=1586233 RepID=UPI001CD94E8B|nr:hypothetical protein [Halomicrobium urmianum]
MNVARTLAVVVVGALLTTTTVAAVATAGAHGTVLDPDFVTETVAEEEGYAVVRNATLSAVEDSVPESAGAAGIDTGAVVAEAVDRRYVRNQTDANVDRLYAYLHGQRAEPDLTVDTRPVKAEASAAVASEVADASLTTLVAESDVELRDPVNATLLERMTSGPAGYQSARATVRDEARERVLDAAVDRAYGEASDDRLLSLVIDDYDPDDYSEAEKERLIDEHEGEIRTALRRYISEERGDEIDSRVDEELDAVREQYAGRTADDTDEQSSSSPRSSSTHEDPVENATLAVQATVATGLTTDVDYGTFRDRLDADRERLGEAAGDRARQRLDRELPDRLDLTQELGDGTTQRLEGARTVVQWFDRLPFVLPAVGALLIGLLYYATRSLPTVLGTTGAALVAGSLPPYLALGVLRDRAAAALGGGDAISGFAVGFVERTLAHVGAVSLAVATVGVLLVAAWLALRYDLLEKLRGGGSNEPRIA